MSDEPEIKLTPATAPDAGFWDGGKPVVEKPYVSEGGELSRRKPGRPPKTTAGVNNANTDYRPSVERNNVDQALQPTGDGDVAGEVEGGEIKIDPVTPAVKLFPVRLKRNYHPISPDWMPMRDDGSYFKRPEFIEGETPKVRAGFAIGLPVEEAKNIITKGIAERADPIE